MKKVLISTIVFIMAMLPLVLLSNSISSNVNSADVNHDGEVNISDVNAVIDIILGGTQEGLNGDVNNDGEINISDINYLINIILGGQPTAIPVINTQIVDNAVIITATGNGIVNLYVDGQSVSNPYVAIRGEEDYYISVYATAQEDGKLMSQCETIRVLIPALLMTQTPIVTADTTENAVIITASGNGVVKLYVNDLLVENPYTAFRNDVDYELTVYATAQEEGKAMSQSNRQSIIVPALGIDETETFTVNGVSFTMVYVEGGTFIMGATTEQGSDARDNEKSAHEVTLSSYCIGETEVTQALWLAVMGSNPSQNIGDLNCPVESVSWTMCQEFITKLNQITGKAFRLPTEAEWEYAARGGNKSQGYKYAGSNNLDVVAWYNENSGFTTHPVATKTSNELGLFDMSGNVWEWCQDWYGEYSIEPQTNPTGPSTSSYRVNRGGIFNGYDWYCRVSFRNYYYPMGTSDNLGLRLALDPDISPMLDDYEYVDLGLPSGTLWATMNIGANSPEEYCDYFAWGETEPKENYDWSTYEWCNGSENTMTKYCTYGYYGTVDGKTELEPEDDAASVNWGASWRMPTVEQLQELIDNCTWTSMQQNGVNGRLVTGPNGNTIFLPAAGSRQNSSLYNAGSRGCCLSRMLYSSEQSGTVALCFSSESVQRSPLGRQYGHTVRAVRVSQN